VHLFKYYGPFTARKIQPVLSVALLFEYEDVLKRNSRKLGLTYWEIDAFLDNTCNLSSFQKIYFLWCPFLPDSKDDHVLELAVASQVKKIATFNAKDFKDVDKFGIIIISPKQLLKEIEWVH
jgi:predicted nucleic acid-binding protein